MWWMTDDDDAIVCGECCYVLDEHAPAVNSQAKLCKCVRNTCARARAYMQRAERR
jgi:hypothetical protein